MRHEQSGAALAASLELTPVLGLRADDLGELLVMAIAGSAMAAVLALGYWRSAAAGRALSVRLFALLAGFAAAAVVVDMVRSVFRETLPGDVLAVIEDGGEMLVVSLMLRLVAREVAAEPAAAISGA